MGNVGGIGRSGKRCYVTMYNRFIYLRVEGKGDFHCMGVILGPVLLHSYSKIPPERKGLCFCLECSSSAMGDRDDSVFVLQNIQVVSITFGFTIVL